MADEITPSVAPAPEAVPAPVVEATPAAPAAADAPTTDPAASQVAPTPEEAADAALKAEDDEWDAALKEQYGDNPTNKKELKKNEPAKPTEDGKTPEANAENPDGKAADAKPGDGDGTEAKSNEAKSPEDLARDARTAARQTQEQTQAVIADVRAKMFANAPTQMVDSDGDPIQTVQDVMKLRNPATGEGFTEEEAYPWLLAAQQKFNETKAADEARIVSIAETNVAIKQEADYVNAKYGAILKADTALRDKLWAQFEKTTVKDPATGIITEMPVSLEEFYELALEGRTVPASAATPPAAPGTTPKPAEAAPNPAKVAADAKAAADKKVADEAKAKQDAETAKQQARADRSDLYIPPSDPKVANNKDDDEWATATKEYYGDRLK